MYEAAFGLQSKQAAKFNYVGGSSPVQLLGSLQGSITVGIPPHILFINTTVAALSVLSTTYFLAKGRAQTYTTATIAKSSYKEIFVQKPSWNKEVSFHSPWCLSFFYIHPIPKSRSLALSANNCILSLNIFSLDKKGTVCTFSSVFSSKNDWNTTMSSFVSLDIFLWWPIALFWPVNVCVSLYRLARNRQLAGSAWQIKLSETAVCWINFIVTYFVSMCIIYFVNQIKTLQSFLLQNPYCLFEEIEDQT